MEIFAVKKLNIKMKFKTSDNVELFYTDTQEDKPAILCLPGLGGSHVLWNLVIERMRNKYRVIVLDPRNQGLSQRTKKGERIARHAIDIYEFLQLMELDNIVGIGNSMGASTLMAYLSIYHGKKFKAMIDLDQSPKMITDSSWPYGFKKLSWDNYPQYLENELGRATYIRVDRELARLAKKEYQKFPYIPADNFQFFADHALQDWRDVLAECRIPFLILAGDHSPYFDYHFAEVVAKTNPLIKAEIIKDCGHIIQAEQPDKMVSAVENFVN